MKFQVPNSKLQLPKRNPEYDLLKLEIWNFFGAWNLELGAF
jgi:hypothetical protein